MEEIDQEIVNINQVNAHIINLYCKWVKDKGINYHTFLVYYALLERKMTQKELSLRTHLIKQTINNIVKQMLERKEIYFEDIPNNKKEKYVVLTKKGEKAAHQVTDDLIEVEHRVVTKVGKEKLQELYTLSQIFDRAMEEEMESSK